MRRLIGELETPELSLTVGEACSPASRFVQQ
jgi:hypothetical protein